MVWASLFTCLPQHCEYHNTSTLSMNVAIMLWRFFLTTFCGNVVAIILKLSWNMLQQLHVPTFSQLSLNVVAMLLQFSSMTRQANIRWEHFHNCCSTFEQCSWITLQALKAPITHSRIGSRMSYESWVGVCRSRVGGSGWTEASSWWVGMILGDSWLIGSSPRQL